MIKITKKLKKSRVGIVETAHGKLKTPFFMPDATRACVKLLGGREVKQAGIEAMVVNTLHLYLQPGMSLVKKFKGVHNFMNWDKPLLSDSGGFQVFSLIHSDSKLGKIYDDKVVFKSPIDGSKHVLTPEKSIQIQFDLGTNMMVVLDDCPPNEFDRRDLEKAVDRTIAWAKRCRKEFDKQIKKRSLSKKRPLLFGVIQGGAELDLRKKCANELIKLNFDGYGFGGRPVDEKGNFLGEVLQYTADLIPEDKLRFALGVGTPDDIIRCYKMGFDMFDCVVPTREGRHGRLYKFKSQKSKVKSDLNFYNIININNSKFKNNTKSIDENCDCELCRNYTAGYLHHLFKIKESLGQRLATVHNLRFYSRLIEDITSF